MTSKTKIYQRGIWPEMHSIISQHTVITLTQERRADIPTTKGIIGLVPSRIGPVPTTRLAECKVKVLKAQWRHPVFCFTQNTSSSWLVQVALRLILRFTLSFLLTDKWFWRRHLNRASIKWQRNHGTSRHIWVKTPSFVWLTIPQRSGVTSILITFDNASVCLSGKLRIWIFLAVKLIKFSSWVQLNEICFTFWDKTVLSGTEGIEYKLECR